MVVLVDTARHGDRSWIVMCRKNETRMEMSRRTGRKMKEDGRLSRFASLVRGGRGART